MVVSQFFWRCKSRSFRQELLLNIDKMFYSFPLTHQKVWFNFPAKRHCGINFLKLHCYRLRSFLLMNRLKCTFWSRLCCWLISAIRLFYMKVSGVALGTFSNWLKENFSSLPDALASLSNFWKSRHFEWTQVKRRTWHKLNCNFETIQTGKARSLDQTSSFNSSNYPSASDEYFYESNINHKFLWLKGW